MNASLRYLSIGLAQSAAVISLPTYASQEFSLEEIIVTAQKRAQSIMDVPAAVAAYGGERLAQSGIDDLADVQMISPSFSLRTEKSPSETSFFVRGLGTTGSGNFEQSVGVYIDGVYRGRPGAALQDLKGIERMEILRGPQSSIFGRNNSAGAVAIHTLKPSDDFALKLDATYGSDALKHIRGSLSGPATDNLAYSIDFSHKETDTYIVNTQGENDFIDRHSIRAQFIYTPSLDTEIRVIADYSDSFDRCCIGPMIFVADADVPVFSSGTISNVSKGTATQGDIEGTLYDPFNHKVSTNQEYGEDATDKGISVQLDHTFDNQMDFTAIASHREYVPDSVSIFEPTGSILQGRAEESQAIDENSLELRIAGSTDSINWLGGLYLFDQEIAQALLASRAVPSGRVTMIDTDSSYTAESQAVFGQLEYTPNEEWGFTAGLRYSQEEKYADIAATGLLAGASRTGAVAGDINLDDDEWMGDLSARRELGEQGSVYLRYGRGYKSGGMVLNPLGLAIDDLSYDPETVDSIELGAKLILLDGQLFLNGALFSQIASDLQVQSWTGVGYATRNAAEVDTIGLELEYIYAVSEDIRFTGGFVYLDSKYKDFMDAPAPLGSSSPSQNLDGEAPLQAPDWTITGGIEKTWHLNGDWEVIAHADYRYTSEYTTDLANDDLFANGSTFQVNGGVQFKRADGSFGIKLWGKNLTGEEIINTGLGVPSSESAWVLINKPATYGLTVMYEY